MDKEDHLVYQPSIRELPVRNEQEEGQERGRTTLAYQLLREYRGLKRGKEEGEEETGEGGDDNGRGEQGEREREREMVLDLTGVQLVLWGTYFGEGSKQDKSILNLIILVKLRFQLGYLTLELSELEERGIVTIDHSQLLRPTTPTLELTPEERTEFLTTTELLTSTFQYKPRLMASILTHAAHEFYLEKTKSQEELDLISETEHLRPLAFRLINHTPTSAMESLKSNLIEKVVTVLGTVVRTSSVKPMAMQVEFVCLACRKSQTTRITDGKFQSPTKCATIGCRSKNVQPERGIDSKTITRDFQTLRIQELKPTDATHNLGRVPRTIECELTDELVDQVIPGDMVKCTGILKLCKADDIGGKSSSKSTMHTVYLDTFSISKLNSVDDESSPTTSSSSRGKDDLELKEKDLQFIEEVFNQPDLMRLIVNSFCPEIFGHEAVKLGILLALFGGRKRHNPNQYGMTIRGDPHVLIVGDPGLGKSQMLSAAVHLAPRGVYVCASSGISSTGLTVTLVKESGSGDFALEAGALVLGDQGCCCIDEFDKMTSERAALLEAMEQQCISIAKAGIVCNLPARTSIIAAANPVGGHYNKSKTVAENLKMGTALLSRFDLVFILLDKPDVTMDQQLSKHVMALHSGRQAGARPESGSSFGHQATQENLSLIQRLREIEGQPIERLPTVLFRKYIAYARKYVHPTLSPKAAATLKAFYLELRQSYRSRDATPITTRQLESLIRLAEARAKMELREVVTEADAIDVVDLMKLSLFDAYADEEGVLDFQRSQNGSGMSRQACIKRFVAHLNRVSDETYCNMFTYSKLYQISQELKLDLKAEFGNFVEMLNHHGYLLKKGPNSYQLLTSNL